MSSPLSGYRVLDLTGEAGAYGTKLLANLGADVIKVEPPRGDAARRLPPFRPGVSAPESSLWFAYMNAGKRSVTLDIDLPEGRDLFLRLVSTADAVFDTTPPGGLEDRGLDPNTVCLDHPDVVWVAITPFGLTGPRRDWRGSDLIAWACSGVLYSTGDSDRPPLVPAGPALLAYTLASLNAAIGGLLALRARRVLGNGQVVDISVQEAAVAVSAEIGLPVYLDDLMPRTRAGNRRPWSRPWGLYPCADGWASLVVSPDHWRAMAAWIQERTGIEGVVDESLNNLFVRAQILDAVDEWTEALTTQYTKRDFFVEGQRRGIPAAPVNTVAEVMEDEHLAARDYWVPLAHPVLGDARMAGPPYRFSRSTWTAGRAPLLGEDNDQIYEKELGVTPSQIAALRAAAVI